MLKRLKRKFILVAMLSVFCVLAVIMLAVNVVNFTKISDYADGVLNVLQKNDGVFPKPFMGEPSGDLPEADRFEKVDKKSFNGMNEETPYETRYFTVRFLGSKIVMIDVNNVAAISKDSAKSMAENAVSGGNERGYDGNYRYLVAESGNFVLFMDCSRQLETAKSFLYASLIISAIGLVAVFVLCLIFSGAAVKPIAESYEKQKQFITDAGHELKTPLTIISANNELTELSMGQTQETQNISKQIERMTAMVKNLTLLAKIDEVGNRPESVKFSLTDALFDLCESFKTPIKEGERNFTYNIGDELFICADEALIRTAISSTLENAAKYAKTNVELNAFKQGKNAIIELKNDADGIKDGNLNAYFERFYRSESARASGLNGNGIGLSVAKAAVELYGGNICAFGENSVFKIKITFPLASVSIK